MNLIHLWWKKKHLEYLTQIYSFKWKMWFITCTIHKSQRTLNNEISTFNLIWWNQVIKWRYILLKAKMLCIHLRLLVKLLKKRLILLRSWLEFRLPTSYLFHNSILVWENRCFNVVLHVVKISFIFYFR